MKMVNVKEVLYGICLERNDDRLSEINFAIKQAQDAIENDTKSSAGDKYETSREMIQQDLNRYQSQLQQAKIDQNIMKQIDLSPKLKGALGALIHTDTAVYFIAISLGRVEIQEEVYMVVSPSSPIGAMLLGKHAQDTVNFKGKSQTVLKVI